ncbi:MAG: hypothetical protein Q9227_005525 [Pyrenula ochraceoflavens]
MIAKTCIPAQVLLKNSQVGKRRDSNLSRSALDVVMDEKKSTLEEPTNLSLQNDKPLLESGCNANNMKVLANGRIGCEVCGSVHLEDVNDRYIYKSYSHLNRRVPVPVNLATEKVSSVSSTVLLLLKKAQHTRQRAHKAAARKQYGKIPIAAKAHRLAVRLYKTAKDLEELLGDSGVEVTEETWKRIIEGSGSDPLALKQAEIQSILRHGLRGQSADTYLSESGKYDNATENDDSRPKHSYCHLFGDAPKYARQAMRKELSQSDVNPENYVFAATFQDKVMKLREDPLETKRSWRECCRMAMKEMPGMDRGSRLEDLRIDEDDALNMALAFEGRDTGGWVDDVVVNLQEPEGFSLSPKNVREDKEKHAK